MLGKVAPKSSLMLLAFAVFTGAYLGFQIQPLIAQWILPLFGGTAAVWSASMLFFQAGLLCGYAYTFALTRYLEPYWQVRIHIILLALTCLALPWGIPVMPAFAAEMLPPISIILVLGTVVGLPYVLLTATAPLLQAWGYSFSATTSPYRLYVISNLGSLVGLLAYPFVLGPTLSLQQQFLLWSLLFLLFCAFFLPIAVQSEDASTEGALKTKVAQPDVSNEPNLSIVRYLIWAGLSAGGSMLLLATTNFLSQDVAVTPFVWVLPFSLYLLSFIITFDRARWYQRKLWFPMGLFLSIYATDFFIRHYRSGIAEINEQLAVFSGALFVGCIVFHGELFRAKPAPHKLPTFYVFLALGGALGGVFVSFVAPVVFSELWELPLSLLMIISVIAAVSLHHATNQANNLFAAAFSLLVTCLLLIGALSVRSLAEEERSDVVVAKRGFYGVIKVRDIDVDESDRRRTLYYGQINHGSEYFNEPLRSTPLSYYDRDSGVGVLMTTLTRNSEQPMTQAVRGRHIGVIGLGTGALSMYQQAGDHFTFFELNPQVVEVAKNEFSYLSGLDQNLSIIVGDGRVALAEAESSSARQFDVLVVDAFSGDAIPTHLLTKEAFELYRSRMKSDGVLAIHISNRFFDFQPLMYGLAESLDWQSALVKRPRSRDGHIKRSTWVIMGDNPALFDQRGTWKYFKEWDPHVTSRKMVWTDDAVNIFPLLD